MALTELTNRFNNSSITKGLSSLKDHIKEYFLLGNTEKGLIELKLDIIGDETLTADCDVTDHYTESNTAYQDQISLKPKIYTVSGEVGELVWYQKDSLSQVIGQVAQRLEGVVSFLPVSSKGFNQFKNTAMKAAQWVDTASNALSKVSNLMSKGLGGGASRSLTHQEQAFQYLITFRDERQFLKIKTPWGILENYVITNLKFNQPKETKDKSFISITIKEMRIVSVTTTEFDADKYQGNALYENQPKNDNGKTLGNNVSISRQATSKDVGNPFKQIGETIRKGSTYFSQATDSSKVLNVWYNSETHGFKVTDMFNKIVTGKDQVNAFKSVENGIKTAIGNRYGNPPLR